jgi:hypothetical protein
MPSRMGGTGAWICVEKGFGGIVVVTPVAVEVWMSWWWNDRGHVGSGCCSRAPVDCARSHPSHRWERVLRLGAPWLPLLPEGSTCLSGEAEIRQGGRALLMTPWELGRGEKISPEVPISPRPFRKARVGWSLSFVPRATDLLSAPLTGRFYWGPYDGALAIVQGAVFCRMLGTLVF